MQHSMPLVTLLVAGIGLAYFFAMITHYFRLSPIIGYLLTGVCIGPATPGYTGDANLSHQLAEIGVILLMFGVGLHFSWNDLLKVKTIATLGALCQIFITTLMALGLSHFLGWPSVEGLIYGLALSVASTVVLLRAFEEYHLLKTIRGQIAVGWLIIEDLFVVLALVLLPALSVAFNESIMVTLGYTILKMMAFFMFMLIVGKRIIPWILTITAQTKSKELFRLAVIAIALCVAYGATKFFGISLAIGSFFAGMILSESKLSQRAAEETLPLRDVFSVLFFVSMGMLLNPNILLLKPLLLLITVIIIVLGKSIAAYLIMIIFRYPKFTALTISISLAQIGEFSFILADMGVKLKMLSPETQDIIIAAAIISIFINQMLFKLLYWIKPMPIAKHKS